MLTEDAPSGIYGDVTCYLDNCYVNNTPPQDLSIYPEYQKRTFSSLVFELSTIVDRSSLPRLREALQGYVHFKDLASLPDAERSTISQAGAASLSAAAADNVMKFLQSQMKDRWRSEM